MRNERPCRNCRSRRRKCIWEKGKKKCERCAQSGTECIPCQTNDSTAGIRDGNDQLLEWWDQASRIEDTLDSAESFLHDYSIDAVSKVRRTPTRSSTPTSSSSSSSNSSSTSTEAETEADAEPVSESEPQWILSVINGRVRLESSIKDFEELMRYHQASIRYLSPLAGLLQRESVRFEGMSASVAIASTGLVMRYTQNRARQITIKELPYHIDYRREIDQLVALYMERYNKCVGIIHELTFMNYYRRLKDPLKSPVTLAMCIDTIAYFYPQLKYTPLEKRQLAEFFYGRCRDMLIEMFDDPDRRLEAVLTTSMLMQYLQDVMMEYAEARRLVTVALLICDDLEAHEIGRMSQVERVMLGRHYVTLQLWEGIINIFLEWKFDFSGVRQISTELLEGESTVVLQYINMWNFINELLGSPYVTMLMQQIGRAVHGQSYELTLEMILQFEPMLHEWWDNLSDEFRICDDPFTPAVDQVVGSITSSIVLMPFAILHSMSALVQSSLLRPPTVSLEYSANDDMIRIIQEKAMSLTLSSTKALVYVMKRNLEIDVEAVPLSIGYMLGTLHAVCSVVNNCAADGIQLSVEVFDLLFRCFTQINALFPAGHQVPPSSSTLEAFMANFKASPMSIYDKFPMPGYAMVSDIFFTCFHQLERGFHLAL